MIANTIFAIDAYLKCSDKVQAEIRKLIRVVYDSNASKDEREAAATTIAEAIFPSPSMEVCEWLARPKQLTENSSAEAVTPGLTKPINSAAVAKAIPGPTIR